MVRKTGEQRVYETDDRAQGKILCGTACATCQHQQVCTQVTGINGSISRATPSQVGVLSQRKKRILRRKLGANKLAQPVLVSRLMSSPYIIVS